MSKVTNATPSKACGLTFDVEGGERDAKVATDSSKLARTGGARAKLPGSLEATHGMSLARGES